MAVFCVKYVWKFNISLTNDIVGFDQLDPDNQGPVVQSIVSLTSSLRGKLVKYFTTLLPNTHVYFWKNERTFSHFYIKNIAVF